MIQPPVFASKDEYVLRLSDSDRWRPYLDEILRRHALPAIEHAVAPGVGGTFPTFLHGDLVIKLFGGWHSWAKSFETERAAQSLLEEAGIAAPRPVASGRLFEASGEAWPYLITTRMTGSPWEDTPLTFERRLSIARDLGREIKRLHRLVPVGIPNHEDWPMLDVLTAAEKSSLPAHLLGQVRGYLARMRPFDRVFVHGDITSRHIFVEGGRLAGIIDWGDATVTDRHYELAKLHLSLFQCDKALLRAFFEASEWPLAPGYEHQALGLALHRQAHGLIQHHSMDVFHLLPSRLPLKDIHSLDDLATELFTI